MTVEDRARSAARDIHRAMETAKLSVDTVDRSSVVRFDRFRARKDRMRTIGTVAVVALLSIVIAIAADSVARDFGTGPANTGPRPVPAEIGTVTMTSDGCSLDTVAAPAPGPFTVRVVNDSDGDQTLVVFRIANADRFDRMLAFVGREHPLFGNASYAAGHGSEDGRLVQSRFFAYASTTTTDIDAHDSLVVAGAFDPGTYGIQCAGRLGEHDRPSRFIGPIEVAEG